MRIELEVSAEHEGTAEPWWMIIDPRQMMSPDCYAVANMVTGPFFSRKEAQSHLDGRRHAFSKRAVVFCASGCWSAQYSNAYRNAEKAQQGPEGR